MKLKKPVRRQLKQKERGVELNEIGLSILSQRTKKNKAEIKGVLTKLLLGKKPVGDLETRIVSELRGMGLVKVEHTEVVEH